MEICNNITMGVGGVFPIHYNITSGGGVSRDPKFALLNIWTAPYRNDWEVFLVHFKTLAYIVPLCCLSFCLSADDKPVRFWIRLGHSCLRCVEAYQGGPQCL